MQINILYNIFGEIAVAGKSFGQQAKHNSIMEDIEATYSGWFINKIKAICNKFTNII